jgi:hypothetical protein
VLNDKGYENMNANRMKRDGFKYCLAGLTMPAVVQKVACPPMSLSDAKFLVTIKADSSLEIK